MVQARAIPPATDGSMAPEAPRADAWTAWTPASRSAGTIRFDVVAPVAGKIVKLLPHAFIVVDEPGRGVLTHVGIDTVKLKGEGFELLAAKGDTVDAGAPVMRVDPAAAVAAGYSLVSPAVVLGTTSVCVLDRQIARE